MRFRCRAKYPQHRPTDRQRPRRWFYFLPLGKIKQKIMPTISWWELLLYKSGSNNNNVCELDQNVVYGSSIYLPISCVFHYTLLYNTHAWVPADLFSAHKNNARGRHIAWRQKGDRHSNEKWNCTTSLRLAGGSRLCNFEIFMISIIGFVVSFYVD